MPPAPPSLGMRWSPGTPLLRVADRPAPPSPRSVTHTGQLDLGWTMVRLQQLAASAVTVALQDLHQRPEKRLLRCQPKHWVAAAEAMTPHSTIAGIVAGLSEVRAPAVTPLLALQAAL